MIYLSIKNWDRHQCKIKPEHRKEFIALHLAVLDDLEFQSLPQSAQVLLIQCWLLRGRLGTNIPYNTEYLGRMLGRCSDDDLQWLVDEGWLIETEEKNPPKQKTMPPRESYSRGSYPEDFETWWKAYPKKLAKADAFKAWEQVDEVRPPINELIDKTSAYADKMKGNEKYLKHPAGWLRDRRWEDDLKVKPKVKGTHINKVLDREQVDNYAHPLWKKYVSEVVAGETKPGFEVYIAGQ